MQILPINDTRVHDMWWDSYPYQSVSVVALHPIYLSLEALFADTVPTELADRIRQAREEGEALDAVDYEATLRVKLQVAHAVFDSEQGKQCASACSRVMLSRITPLYL